MRRKRLAVLCALALVIVLSLSVVLGACDNVNKTEYKIVFDYNGGAVGEYTSFEVSAKAGTQLDISGYSPVRKGYTLVGWTDGKNTFTSTYTVLSDAVLKAVWIKSDEITTQNIFKKVINAIAGDMTYSFVFAGEGKDENGKNSSVSLKARIEDESKYELGFELKTENSDVFALYIKDGVLYVWTPEMGGVALSDFDMDYILSLAQALPEVAANLTDNIKVGPLEFSSLLDLVFNMFTKPSVSVEETETVYSVVINPKGLKSIVSILNLINLDSILSGLGLKLNTQGAIKWFQSILTDIDITLNIRTDSESGKLTGFSANAVSGDKEKFSFNTTEAGVFDIESVNSFVPESINGYTPVSLGNIDLQADFRTDASGGDIGLFINAITGTEAFAEGMLVLKPDLSYRLSVKTSLDIAQKEDVDKNVISVEISELLSDGNVRKAIGIYYKDGYLYADVAATLGSIYGGKGIKIGLDMKSLIGSLKKTITAAIDSVFGTQNASLDGDVRIDKNGVIALSSGDDGYYVSGGVYNFLKVILGVFGVNGNYITMTDGEDEQGKYTDLGFDINKDFITSFLNAIGQSAVNIPDFGNAVLSLRLDSNGLRRLLVDAKLNGGVKASVEFNGFSIGKDPAVEGYASLGEYVEAMIGDESKYTYSLKELVQSLLCGVTLDSDLTLKVPAGRYNIADILSLFGVQGLQDTQTVWEITKDSVLDAHISAKFALEGDSLSAQAEISLNEDFSVGESVLLKKGLLAGIYMNGSGDAWLDITNIALFGANLPALKAHIPLQNVLSDLWATLDKDLVIDTGALFGGNKDKALSVMNYDSSATALSMSSVLSAKGSEIIINSQSISANITIAAIGALLNAFGVKIQFPQGLNADLSLDLNSQGLSIGLDASLPASEGFDSLGAVASINVGADGLKTGVNGLRKEIESYVAQQTADLTDAQSNVITALMDYVGQMSLNLSFDIAVNEGADIGAYIEKLAEKWLVGTDVKLDLGDLAYSLDINIDSKSDSYALTIREQGINGKEVIAARALGKDVLLSVADFGTLLLRNSEIINKIKEIIQGQLQNIGNADLDSIFQGLLNPSENPGTGDGGSQPSEPSDPSEGGQGTGLPQSIVQLLAGVSAKDLIFNLSLTRETLAQLLASLGIEADFLSADGSIDIVGGKAQISVSVGEDLTLSASLGIDKTDVVKLDYGYALSLIRAYGDEGFEETGENDADRLRSYMTDLLASKSDQTEGIQNMPLADIAKILCKYLNQDEVVVFETREDIENYVRKVLSGISLEANLTMEYEEGQYNILELISKFTDLGQLGLPDDASLIMSFGQPTIDLKIRLQSAITGGDDSAIALEIIANQDLSFTAAPTGGGEITVVKAGTSLIGLYVYNNSLYIDATALQLLGLNVPVFKADNFTLGKYIYSTVNNAIESVLDQIEGSGVLSGSDELALAAPADGETGSGSEEGGIALTLQKGKIVLSVSMSALSALISGLLTGDAAQTAGDILGALDGVSVNAEISRYEHEGKGEYAFLARIGGNILSKTDGTPTDTKITLSTSTQDIVIGDESLAASLNQRLGEKVSGYDKTYSDIVRGLAERLFSGSMLIDVDLDATQGKYYLNSLINSVLGAALGKEGISVPISVVTEDFAKNIQLALQWSLNPESGSLTMMLEVRNNGVVLAGIYLYKGELLVDLTGVGLINAKIKNIALIDEITTKLTQTIESLQGLDLNEILGGLFKDKTATLETEVPSVPEGGEESGESSPNAWISQILGAVMLENANIKLAVSANLIEELILTLAGKEIDLGDDLFDVKANLGIFSGRINFDANLFADGEKHLIKMSVDAALSNGQIVNSAYIPSKFVFESYEIDATDAQSAIKDVIDKIADVSFSAGLGVSFAAGTYDIADLIAKFGVSTFEGTDLLWTFTKDTTIKLRLEVSLKASSSDGQPGGKYGMMSVEIKADGDVNLGSSTVIKDGTVLIGAYSYEGITYLDLSGIKVLGLSMPVFRIDFNLLGAVISKITQAANTPSAPDAETTVKAVSASGEVTYLSELGSGDEISIGITEDELSVAATLGAIASVLKDMGINLGGFDLSKFDLSFVARIKDGIRIEVSGNVLGTTDGKDSSFKAEAYIDASSLTFGTDTDKLSAMLAEKAQKYAGYTDDVINTFKNMLGNNSIGIDLAIDAHSGQINVMDLLSGVLANAGLNLDFPINLNFDNLDYDWHVSLNWNMEARKILLEVVMKGSVNNKTLLGLYGDGSDVYISLGGVGLFDLKARGSKLVNKLFDTLEGALAGIDPIIISDILKDALLGSSGDLQQIAAEAEETLSEEEKASTNELIRYILSSVSLSDSKVMMNLTSETVKLILSTLGIESDFVLEAGINTDISDKEVAGYVTLGGIAEFGITMALNGKADKFLPEDTSKFVSVDLGEVGQGASAVKQLLDGYNFAFSLDLRSNTVGTVVDSSEEENMYTRIAIEKINGTRTLDNHGATVTGPGILVTMYDIDESEYMSHGSGRKSAMLHFFLDYTNSKATLYLCSGHFKIVLRVGPIHPEIDLATYLSSLALDMDVLSMLGPLVDNIIASVNGAIGEKEEQPSTGDNSGDQTQPSEPSGFAKVFADLDINELLRPGITLNILSTGVGNLNVKLDAYAFNGLIDSLMNCVLGADTQVDLSSMVLNGKKMFSKNYLEYMWWDRLAASNTRSPAEDNPGTPYSVWDSIIRQLKPIISDVIGTMQIQVAGITLTGSTVNTFLDAVLTSQNLHRIVKRILPLATFNTAELNLNLIEGTVANVSFSGRDTGEAIKKYEKDAEGNWYQTSQLLTQTVKSKYQISDNYDSYTGTYSYTYVYGSSTDYAYGGKGIMYRSGYSQYLYKQHGTNSYSFGNDIQVYNMSQSVGDEDLTLDGTQGIVDWGNLSSNISFNPYLYNSSDGYAAAAQKYWDRYFTGFENAVYQYGTSVKRGKITLSYNGQAFTKQTLQSLMNKAGVHSITATATYPDGTSSVTTVRFTVMDVKSGGADCVRSVQPINLHVYESIPDYATVTTYGGKTVKYYFSQEGVSLSGDYIADSPSGGKKTAKLAFANGSVYDVEINYADSSISDQTIDIDWYDLDFSGGDTEDGKAEIRQRLLSLFTMYYNDGTFIPQVLIDNATWDMSGFEQLIARDRTDLSAAEYSISVTFDKKIAADGKTLVQAEPHLVQTITFTMSMRGKDKISIAFDKEQSANVIHVNPYEYYMYVSTGDEKYNPFPAKATAGYSDSSMESVFVSVTPDSDIVWGYADNSTTRGNEVFATVNTNASSYEGKGWFNENFLINVKVEQNKIKAIYFDSEKTQTYIQRGETYESAYVVFSNGLEMQMPVFVREAGEKAFVYIGFDLAIYEQYGKLSAFTGLEGDFLQAYAVEIR